MLTKIINGILNNDEKIKKESRERVDNLIKPKGSLGKVEDLFVKLCGIYGEIVNEIPKKAIIIAAGDHKVVEEGVATSDKSITLFQVNNFTKGLTGVCSLVKTSRADIFVVDVGVDNEIDNPKVISRKIKYGSDNIAKGPAMTYEEAVKSIEVGIEMVFERYNEGYRMLGVGEMGIGNTTPSSAIISVLSGIPPEETTSVGANLPLDKLANKVDTIKKAIEVNSPDSRDPLDVLSKVGGLEIGTMAGVILGCAYKKIPVVLDGFISVAAAMIAKGLCEKSVAYMIPSHNSKEKGAILGMRNLGLEPYFDFDMRLGEGTGAAIMFNFLDSAIYMNSTMITFEEAGFRVL